MTTDPREYDWAQAERQYIAYLNEAEELSHDLGVLAPEVKSFFEWTGFDRDAFGRYYLRWAQEQYYPNDDDAYHFVCERVNESGYFTRNKCYCSRKMTTRFST